MSISEPVESLIGAVMPSNNKEYYRTADEEDVMIESPVGAVMSYRQQEH